MEYLTADEKRELESRLEGLNRTRLELIERIADARSKGDLRENADYHAAREDAAMNKSLIQELEERLKHAKVTDESVVPEGMVFVGSTVRLREVDSGDEDVYKLVGEAKVDDSSECIPVSPNSPMGQSLMKARVGERIRVDLPRGAKHYEIIEIL